MVKIRSWFIRSGSSSNTDYNLGSGHLICSRTLLSDLANPYWANWSEVCSYSVIHMPISLLHSFYLLHHFLPTQKKGCFKKYIFQTCFASQLYTYTQFSLCFLFYKIRVYIPFHGTNVAGSCSLICFYLAPSAELGLRWGKVNWLYSALLVSSLLSALVRRVNIWKWVSFDLSH